VIKALDIPYVFANPAATFRGLQESVINYGNNTRPELITCLHEEQSAAMAHGYFKIEGKPAAIMAHSVVGLQHASMALYNAYVDRVPVYVILGNHMDAKTRITSDQWYHSVQDPAVMVRDYVKWDDEPASLQHFAESAVRAYQIAMTPPMGPVVLTVDAEMQELPIPASDHGRLRIPKLVRQTPPQGDFGAIREVARLLVEAENPTILGGTSRTEAGRRHYLELREVLGSPSASVATADVIFAIEVADLYFSLNRATDLIHKTWTRIAKPDAKVITLGLQHLNQKSNYQNFYRYTEADLAIAGDAEATLPLLIEEVKRAITPARRRAFDERAAKNAAAAAVGRERARAAATLAWGASPISTNRLGAEIWRQIRTEDWSQVMIGLGVSTALWNFDTHYRSIGSWGGGGMGYGPPAAVGAALANKKYGRFSIAVQGDGDFMYSPGALWTAAHHRIPLLMVMHNNRGYHQEKMHIQRMANRRNRGIENGGIGCTIDDPGINYAMLARSMGWYAEGPIDNPNDLEPALARAKAVVKRGEPALVDVVTQPR
jgi:acetolactate synthase-1/2/3 large subunit